MLNESLSTSRERTSLSKTLKNRTFFALIVSQFLAAFNDQAINASAMFFAIHSRTLTEEQAISLMPVLFYTPWFLFVTLAGYFADRYSKRNALVFWKLAEIVITAIALAGFWFGQAEGVTLVLSTVFFMGMHAAFFGPAKYGIMPEILEPELLSRGNGYLESFSFLGTILGSICGGVFSFLFQGSEWIIGIILGSLALIGFFVSLQLQKIPAANPQRPFPRYIYFPLIQNFRHVLATRDLLFAIVGIAFFTFVVTFLRATVYMFGESQSPRWDELKTSAVVGTVACGLGLGCPLAGWLSGKKIELGLIPIGALGIAIGCLLASLFTASLSGLIFSTVLIGFSTSFFLVPLFSLLQYSAARTSKGEMFAISNFVDVGGAVLSSVLFLGCVAVSKRVELAPEVAMKELASNQNFLKVELREGRPVQVTLGEGENITQYGQPAGEVASVVSRIFRPVEAEQLIITIDSGVTPGSRVAVWEYRIGNVKHLVVAPEGRLTKSAYDFRKLPPYLFGTAGVLALIMLLVLRKIMPDLFRQTLRFIAGSRESSSAWPTATAPVRPDGP
ncbi:MFS transporter [Telmatocola sphagniphila]|uniref:MFS transporter n=1 Tax=Telmatocola sphagniphila TaxID=1123043 RepID=A0A8E6B8Z3_9BACT|nr:MFS transporter [Telmatocola sphagniphila]QVL34365.1 MFS transporter [Telmatocola sphagniphila]